MHIQHSPNQGADEHEPCPEVVDVDIRLGDALQQVQAVSKNCKVIRRKPERFGSRSHRLYVRRISQESGDLL